MNQAILKEIKTGEADTLQGASTVGLEGGGQFDLTKLGIGRLLFIYKVIARIV